MEYDNFKISKHQAQAFARSILHDISQYIREHQTEYEDFISMYEEKINNENNSTYR